MESGRIGADWPRQPKSEASGYVRTCALLWGKGLAWAKNGHKHALRSNAVKNHPSSGTVIEWRMIGLKSVNALS